jgi:hypothetical protein
MARGRDDAYFLYPFFVVPAAAEFDGDEAFDRQYNNGLLDVMCALGLARMLYTYMCCYTMNDNSVFFASGGFLHVGDVVSLTMDSCCSDRAVDAVLPTEVAYEPCARRRSANWIYIVMI